MAEDKKENMVRGFLRDAALAIIGGLVIEPTLARLRIDISNYLPQTWLGILGFVMVDGALRSQKFRRWAIAYEQSLSIGRKGMAYLVVALIGAVLFILCWFSITKLLNKPLEEAHGSQPTLHPSPTPALPPASGHADQGQPTAPSTDHPMLSHPTRLQASADRPLIKMQAYLQPDEPYFEGTLLAGIVWQKQYVDVRVDIANGPTDVHDLDFIVGLDTSIAGVGQISQFLGFTAFPDSSPPPAWLQGTDLEGKPLSVPMAPMAGAMNTAPVYRVRCSEVFANTVVHLVIASIALNSAVNGRMPSQLFATRRPPRAIKIKGKYETRNGALITNYTLNFSSEFTQQ
jgi:hypothetical protein